MTKALLKPSKVYFLSGHNFFLFGHYKMHILFLSFFYFQNGTDRQNFIHKLVSLLQKSHI